MAASALLSIAIAGSLFTGGGVGAAAVGGVGATDVGGFGAGVWTAAGAHAPPTAAGSQVDPDSVLLGVHLRPDGPATWRIEYRVRLDDENATAAFDALGDDVEANRSRYLARFEERMGPTIDAAADETGREMAIRNATVDTRRQTIGQEYGVLAYSFEWVGFAVVDGARIEAGDALAGFFLDAETSLRVSWPAGYRPVDVRPSPDESGADAVTWRGRFDFAADEPFVAVTSAPPPTTGSDPGTTRPGTPGTSPGGGPPDDGSGGLSSATLAGLAVLVLAVVGAGGWLLARRRGDVVSGGGVGREADPGDGPSGDSAGDEPQGRPPEELLSNEERVLRLLSDHGGRIKQQAVAAELDWTDAKTSQVVSSLREAGELESFRLGRENVLTLPGHDLVGGGDDNAAEEGDDGDRAAEE